MIQCQDIFESIHVHFLKYKVRIYGDNREYCLESFNKFEINNTIEFAEKEGLKTIDNKQLSTIPYDILSVFLEISKHFIPAEYLTLPPQESIDRGSISNIKYSKD